MKIGTPGEASVPESAFFSVTTPSNGALSIVRSRKCANASERFFLDVYCLRPGQAQTAHAHAGSDKVYVALEGRPTVEVDGEHFLPVAETG